MANEDAAEAALEAIADEDAMPAWYVQKVPAAAYDPTTGANATAGEAQFQCLIKKFPANPDDFAPGSLDRRYVEMLLVPALGLAVTPDLDGEWLFGGHRWNTLRLDRLAPGGSDVLFTIWVERGR